MKIRTYNKNDIDKIYKLFYYTVHYINCRHYDKVQMDTWAKADIDIESWAERFSNTYTIVVELNDRIVGFSNIDKTGIIDMFFVHKDYQTIGIGTFMLKHLLNYVKENNIEKISTQASITARGFFKRKGFETISKNQVKIDNVSFTNYTMEKDIK